MCSGHLLKPLERLMCVGLKAGPCCSLLGSLRGCGEASYCAAQQANKLSPVVFKCESFVSAIST